ncbi:metallophosphoesterase family protein, partial [candidate division KSB1 bacterium]
DVHERAEDLDLLLQSVELKELDMMFYTGDILNWIGEEERIFNGFLDVSVQHFASRKPFVFVRGNHETRGPNARKLMSYFPHSSGKSYYCFNQGNVHFILLDSGEDKPDSHPVYAGLVDFDAYRSEQAEWLKKVVESDAFKNSMYKVVINHIPLFSGSDGHGAKDITKKWGPVLNEAGIDLMLSGHHHRFAIVQANERENRFPIVILGKDMFLRAEVTTDQLSIKVTGIDGSVVENIQINPKK